LGPRASVANEMLVIELKIATQQLGKVAMELGPVLEHLRMKEPTMIVSPVASTLSASVIATGRKDSGAGSDLAAGKGMSTAASGADKSSSKLLNRLNVGFSKIASSVQQAANTAMVQARAELQGVNGGAGEPGSTTSSSAEGAASTADTPSASTASSIFAASSPVTATSSLSSSELSAYATLVSRVCDEANEFHKWCNAALDGLALKKSFELYTAGKSEEERAFEEAKLVATFLTCSETRTAYQHCKTAASQWSALPTEIGIATRRITAFLLAYFLPLVLHDASLLLGRYLEKQGSGESLFFKKLPSQQ
jgi:hypothetical protein